MGWFHLPLHRPQHSPGNKINSTRKRIPRMKRADSRHSSNSSSSSSNHIIDNVIVSRKASTASSDDDDGSSRGGGGGGAQQEEPDGMYLAHDSLVAAAIAMNENANSSSLAVDSSSNLWNEVCQETKQYDPGSHSQQSYYKQTGDHNHNNDQEAMDRALAESLQQKFDQSLENYYHQKSNSEEGHDVYDQHMLTTSTGKALDFTRRVIANHNSLMEEFRNNNDDRINNNNGAATASGDNNNNNNNSNSLSDQFDLVNVDDMVFLAERVFSLQEAFAGVKDPRVDIGYHYTRGANMSRIRTDGLMTNAERQMNSNQYNNSGFNANVFGDGIYTANNPFSYHNFAGSDQCLLVARLKGEIEIAPDDSRKNTRRGCQTATADTLLGRANLTDEVCVLQSSKQCVALVQFPASLVDINRDDSLGNKLVYDYHIRIQQLIDECFNEGKAPTDVHRYRPSEVTIRALLTPAAAMQRNITTFSNSLREIIYYTAPESVKQDLNIRNEEDMISSLATNELLSADCALCHQTLRGNGDVGRVCRLPRCCHEFHENCVRKLFQRHTRKCPTCSKAIGHLQGKLPKQTLFVDPKSSPGSLVIKYGPDGSNNSNRQQKLAADRNPNNRWMTTVKYAPGGRENQGTPVTPRFECSCGSTFDMVFSTRSDSGRTAALDWKLIHDTSAVLKRLRKSAAKHCKKCSTCRKNKFLPSKLIPIGTMPTGVMRIDDLSSTSCEGFEPGTIAISYKFEQGTQLSYHENPGHLYISSYRTAYIPDVPEGRKLLKRFKCAFTRGYMFDIGTSMTSGLPNSIIWATVPHKTSLTNGQFGYPDKGYFAKANEELDLLGIPDADSL